MCLTIKIHMLINMVINVHLSGIIYFIIYVVKTCNFRYLNKENKLMQFLNYSEYQ